MSAGGPPQGAVSVASLANNVNGVRVRTESDAGAATDKAFHLVVVC